MHPIQKFTAECEKLTKPYGVGLEKPPKEIDADLAMPCFTLAKEMKKSPQDIAKEIAKSIAGKKHESIKKIEASGPYVNFYAGWEKISVMVIKQVIKENWKYGSGKKSIGAKQTDAKRINAKGVSQRGAKQSASSSSGKVIVEFAHPNTHKLFHIGHLRNITTGEAVSRILEFSGTNVIRANYQGDVGLHIAKCLWAIGKTGLEKSPSLSKRIEFLGNAYAKGSKAYEEDEKAKSEIIEINKNIYEKDPKTMKLWKLTREWSLEYFDKIYERVDTTFNRLYFESEVSQPGLNLAKQALKRGILESSDGAVIFDGTNHGLDKRVFINNKGLPTYEAKELGLAELEFSEFGKIDKCIHVVGPEQASFFKVTFKVEELLNPKKFKDRQFHLAYGWVRLREGKMSSRLGNVIEGEWLLDELKKNILEKYVGKQDYPENKKQEIAETIAIGATKYYFLRFNTPSEISFDMNEAVSLEGDTGPYLQYTYARARSILRKSREHKKEKDGSRAHSIHGTISREEMAVVKKLSEFPHAIEKSAGEYKPNLVANYLFELATAFNEFYHAKQVIGSGQEKELLAMVEAVSIVLSSGLKLLGIRTLERM